MRDWAVACNQTFQSRVWGIKQGDQHFARLFYHHLCIEYQEWRISGVRPPPGNRFHPEEYGIDIFTDGTTPESEPSPLASVRSLTASLPSSSVRSASPSVDPLAIFRSSSQMNALPQNEFVRTALDGLRQVALEERRKVEGLTITVNNMAAAMERQAAAMERQTAELVSIKLHLQQSPATFEAGPDPAEPAAGPSGLHRPRRSPQKKRREQRRQIVLEEVELSDEESDGSAEEVVYTSRSRKSPRKKSTRPRK